LGCVGSPRPKEQTLSTMDSGIHSSLEVQ
jgi:hypothetical protein